MRCRPACSSPHPSSRGGHEHLPDAVIQRQLNKKKSRARNQRQCPSTGASRARRRPLRSRVQRWCKSQASRAGTSARADAWQHMSAAATATPSSSPDPPSAWHVISSVPPVSHGLAVKPQQNPGHARHNGARPSLGARRALRDACPLGGGQEACARSCDVRRAQCRYGVRGPLLHATPRLKHHKEHARNKIELCPGRAKHCFKECSPCGGCGIASTGATFTKNRLDKWPCAAQTLPPARVRRHRVALHLMNGMDL